MPYLATPIISPDTNPQDYIITTTTTMRTAALNRFYSSYDNQPPSDYSYSLYVRHETNTVTLDINIAASTLEEASDYLRQQIQHMFPDSVSINVRLLSITTHKLYRNSESEVTA